MKAKTSNWHSKLEAYRFCPRKYKYAYVEGLSEGGDFSADLGFGIALHAGIEGCLKGENGEEIFSTLWEYYASKGLKYGRFNFVYLAEIGEGFVRKFKKAYLPKIEPIQIEKRLFGELGGYEYEGTPDTIAKYEGVCSVIDWKTTGYRYDKDKILTAEQLINYAALAKQSGLKPTPKQVIYFPFVKGTGSIQKPLIYKLTQKHIDMVSDDTVAWIKQMRADKTFARSSSSCIRGTMKCGFFDRCWK